MTDRGGPLLSVGDVVGGFRLERPLGGGGQSSVVGAVREGDGARVALKLAPWAERTAARFEREARLMTTLAHPRLVPCLGSGVDVGWCWLAMPLLGGGTWRARASIRPVPLREAVEVGVEVLDALEHLHAQGVVHRDVKPGNVLFDAARAPYLADLGLALVHAEGRPSGRGVGTGGYRAPEQEREGAAVDARADLFAFGVTLHRVTTLRRPRRRRDGRPDLDVDLPDALEPIVLRCLEQEPADRWASAAELRTALRAVVP